MDGDTLIYCWEQFDAGAQAPPNDDSGNQLRAYFRSHRPVSNPSRSFPNLNNLIARTSPTLSFEALPKTDQAMNFRVTARDQRGGFAFGTVGVITTTTCGPFEVTQPATPATWTAGSKHAVRWNVAKTNLAPVACANVSISLLELDGQNNVRKEHVLLSNTANDGTEIIVIPRAAISKGRLKITAVGNSFFAISPANIRITLR